MKCLARAFRRLRAARRPRVVCCALLMAPALSAAETWLLIDTDARTLQLWDGETVVRTWENIAIGSRGASNNRLFKIQRKKRHKNPRRFRVHHLSLHASSVALALTL